MKTDRAEASGVSAAVVRTALSHPEVAVRYIKDSKEELRTPGDGRMDSVIYSVFGRDFARNMLPAETSDNDITVKGYVSTPAACRGNRGNQFFFVNGRHVKSKTLQAALEQAYKNSLFTGRYPSCILYITMSTALVDVNVHPAKTEVRFLRERQVFDGVYYAALSALESEGPGSADVKLTSDEKKILTQPAEPKRFVPAQSAPASQPRGAVKPSDNFFKTMPAQQYRSSISGGLAGGFKNSPVTFRERGGEYTLHDFSRISYTAGSQGNKKSPDMPLPKKITTYSAEPSPKSGNIQQSDIDLSSIKTDVRPEMSEPEQQLIRDMPLEMSYRYVGEALNTYLIVESGSSIWFIDKHAAHERLNFDKLKNSGYTPMVQPLLVPVVCKLGVSDTQLLMDNNHVLERFGIQVDPFGEDTVAVRQLPSDIEQDEIQALLEELCDDIRSGGRGDENARIDNIMHTMACKAAIKAGKRTEPGQLDGLIRSVLSGQVRYCPHGRPVAIEMTKSALDKSFKRTL
jgi:DNA mismatch repair protein MutL